MGKQSNNIPSISIEKIKFNDETSIEFKNDDIVLLVGANNVGKSRTLKDLKDDLNDLSKSKVIVDEVIYNRPHYYCFEDTATGIYWMIPLSSRIDKFRKIIEKKEQLGKHCDILHIVKLDDSRESVFLIQDMFPITEEYIEREYTIAGNHLMLTSEHTAKVIEQKARKVLGMLKRGVKFMPTQPDVLSILEKLKQKK